MTIFHSEINQCKLLNCPYGQDCSVDENGVAECICGNSCEPIVRPVCGSNGLTYDNLCEMKKFACNKSENITAKYIGICGNVKLSFHKYWKCLLKNKEFPFNLGSSGPCQQNPCNFNAICVETSEFSFICECPECSQVMKFFPFTYQNQALK